ncbi:MAG: hypothetical protein KDD64_03120, partial [Bdellovibrionales bacterium]|nr:hypothetical protein [Bdellovibrionales bacterium]
ADFLVGLLEQLKESHHRAEQAASSFGARAVLAGILPGYRLEHFPKERFVSNRYRNLDAGIKALTGRQSFDVHLEGPEGVAFCAPYILVEAINTSFQLHLSVAPDRFVRTYNVVQAISGIALAPAVNSPVVFGRECWAESRIPIWEQATRPEQVPFGDSWITSPLDPLFDLRRYDAILIDPEVIEAAPTAAEEHLDDLAKRTLALQNGIVWRWNRLCFGDDHLRIESRFLPAGPTPIDMVANAAFFYGLILGVSLELSNRFGASSIEDLLPFEVAKRNFRQAAQFGPAAQLQWIDSSGKLERYPARTLCLMLLPLADRGLESVGVPAKQREEFLGIVRDRLIHKQSGAEWIVARLRQLRGERHPSPEQALALELHKYQSEKNSAFRGSARPVHLWGRNSGD